MAIGPHQIISARRPSRSISGTAAKSMTMLTQLGFVRIAYNCLGVAYLLRRNSSIERVLHSGHFVEVTRVCADNRHTDGNLPMPWKERDNKTALMVTVSDAPTFREEYSYSVSTTEHIQIRATSVDR